jgi:ATP-dependent Clp protease ATP-binding subunit ClpA
VDFKNTVVIMTSNIGSQYIEAIPIGASSLETETLYDKMKAKVTEQLKLHFRPELLNRIDEIIVFHALNKEQIKQIVDLLLKNTERQLSERKLHLDVTEAAKELIADSGFDPLYGARPLRRTIQRMVENPISSGILRREFRDGDTIIVDSDGDKIVTRLRIPSAEKVTA